MSQPNKESVSSIEIERREATPANKYRRSIFSVPVSVTVSVGQQKLSVYELLELEEEAIIPLTASIDDPVELIVDGKVIARGELIETEGGGLAIRVTEIPEPSDG